MTSRNLLTFAACGVVAFLASCASKAPVEEPVVAKTNPEYVNPFPVGTYKHFTAEKDYPKTRKVWRNEQLLPETNSSNSWIKVDLKTQRGKLMNGDVVVMDYPISSGKKSHPTPPGEYKILEKIVDKRSNLYGKILDAEGKVVKTDADSRKDEVPAGGKFLGAPMKYWMRMTNGGIGHHVGNVPRYPASHACIRGPRKVMPTVYSKVKVGTRILVV